MVLYKNDILFLETLYDEFIEDLKTIANPLSTGWKSFLDFDEINRLDLDTRPRKAIIRILDNFYNRINNNEPDHALTAHDFYVGLDETVSRTHRTRYRAITDQFLKKYSDEITWAGNPARNAFITAHVDWWVNLSNKEQGRKVPFPKLMFNWRGETIYFPEGELA